MNHHITYLFGAGASYNAMPIVKEINEELRLLEQVLQNSSYVPKKLNDFRMWLKGKSDMLPVELQRKNVAQTLLDEAHRFASIDTYAKWLHQNSYDGKLLALKQLVNAYFCIRHYLSEDYDVLRNAKIHNEYKLKNLVEPRNFANNDMRFDSLLANIMKRGSSEIPRNISLLTWNYDLLFEFAYARFRSGQLLPNGTERLESTPILHLNGYANIASDYARTPETMGLPIGTQGQIDSSFFSFHNYKPTIAYAWEMDKHKADRLAYKLRNTTHLVVVGYSFPDFNRAIDRQIVGAPNLRKITIQDLSNALSSIKSRVANLLGDRANYLPPRFVKMSLGREVEIPNSRKGVEIETMDSVDQFHIPFELV